MNSKIKVGVSSCLLGNKVRYDGGHKQDRYITDILGSFFTFVPVCPEVECGLPVPREAMHLEGDPEAPRLVTIRSRVDYTEQMKSFCTSKIKELEQENLSAFIFKSKSPSSGLHRIKIYSPSGFSGNTSRGLFADAFVKTFPLVPVEDEGRLHDIALRENFIERIFCFHRWKLFMQQNPNYKKLITFHANHKLQLMAHSTRQLSMMGKLVARSKTIGPAELYQSYQAYLLEALKLKATVKKNVNVLQHIMGYFKKLISADEKKELLELIESYAAGYTPLIVPLTMLKHYIRKYNIDYLEDQTYLEPHPSELMLRNHV